MTQVCDKEIALAEEKLAAAKHLYGIGYYRDAVSRAYYCMYHAAKAILALREIYPRTHSGVVNEFGLRFIKEDAIEELYGKSLRFAKEMREKSDYDFLIDVLQEEAETIISDAKRFLGRIKRAISEIEGGG